MTEAPEAAYELQDLMRRVAGRDRIAFAKLYDRVSAQLFGVALRILKRREEAEEVLQESFIAIWERAAGFDPKKGSAMAWMTTILRHRAIDRRRRHSPLDERSGSEDELLAIAAGPSDDPERGARLAALQTCLGQLEDMPRRSVLLIYAYGYTHEELAVKLAAPLGTVKSWVRRSLERLQRCLDG